mmetsp:Transcript_26601/g.57785  ORF Transcript_26601/g.57785 Transcript_26601/m.57785 type:complete len:236 (+) Transcript_26601:3713-4420(+)
MAFSASAIASSLGSFLKTSIYSVASSTAISIVLTSSLTLSRLAFEEPIEAGCPFWPCALLPPSSSASQAPSSQVSVQSSSVVPAGASSFSHARQSSSSFCAGCAGVFAAVWATPGFWALLVTAVAGALLPVGLNKAPPAPGTLPALPLPGLEAAFCSTVVVTMVGVDFLSVALDFATGLTSGSLPCAAALDLESVVFLAVGSHPSVLASFKRGPRAVVNLERRCLSTVRIFRCSC